MALHETPRSASCGDVAGSPRSPTAKGPLADDRGAEDYNYGESSESISLARQDSAAKPAIVNVQEIHQRARHQSLAPSIGNDHTRIYWQTPAKMISAFFIGLACAAIHAVFYMTRDGGIVPSPADQLWTLRCVFNVFALASIEAF